MESYGEASRYYLCIVLGYKLAMGWLWAGYGLAMERLWGAYGMIPNIFLDYKTEK